ncbi:hypothetical protein N665_0195s0012 [Sinapis alba]|nr:hypothetical protein N665_0195s0012 [Sinapis alba]
MFFFLAGGLGQQVRQVLKSGAGKCIRCGSEADLVDYDKVLKLFFVPVWRWPGKDPALHCTECDLFFPQSLSPPISLARCRFCDRVVQPEFRFCPNCGSSL